MAQPAGLDQLTRPRLDPKLLQEFVVNYRLHSLTMLDLKPFDSECCTLTHEAGHVPGIIPLLSQRNLNGADDAGIAAVRRIERFKGTNVLVVGTGGQADKGRDCREPSGPHSSLRLPPAALPAIGAGRRGFVRRATPKQSVGKDLHD